MRWLNINNTNETNIMTNTIKMRVTREGNTAKIKALIKHPMETGRRKNSKTGSLVPEHFIQEVTCQHNQTIVLDATWGIAISSNPYLSFIIENISEGDNVYLSWKDNKGQSDSTSRTIA